MSVIGTRASQHLKSVRSETTAGIITRPLLWQQIVILGCLHCCCLSSQYWTAVPKDGSIWSAQHAVKNFCVECRTMCSQFTPQFSLNSAPLSVLLEIWRPNKYSSSALETTQWIHKNLCTYLPNRYNQIAMLKQNVLQYTHTGISGEKNPKKPTEASLKRVVFKHRLENSKVKMLNSRNKAF